MTTKYNYDKQLIKDFIRWASDTHRCALVCFPDEFTANAYVSHRFVNTVDLINEWDEGRKK